MQSPSATPTKAIRCRPDKTAQPLLFRGRAGPLETVRYRTRGDRPPDRRDDREIGIGLGRSRQPVRDQNRAAGSQRREASRLADRAERFPLFLFAAFVLLVLGCLPAGRGWNWNWRWTWSWRRSLRSPGSGRRCCWSRPCWQPVPATPHRRSRAESAESAVARGKPPTTPAGWTRPRRLRSSGPCSAPSSAVAAYNAAATLFQLKQYARARSATRRPACAPTRLADQDRLCSGQHGARPGRHRRGDPFVRRLPRLDAPAVKPRAVRQDAAINRRFALEQAQSPAIAEGQNPDDPSRPSDQSGGAARIRRQQRRRLITRRARPRAIRAAAARARTPATRTSASPAARRRRTGGAGGRNGGSGNPRRLAR